ncbi:MAG TPA: CDP-alcohol phosphatidyltransferase family protein, partial [Rhizomicrobium sp.]|nr:CDP-alcohol phosphatidyltransferase family protein [Rhizomicrobium sp.]
VALMMLVAEGSVREFTEFNWDPNLSSLLRLVPALIILSREILVSGLREFLAETRVKIRVTAVAKLKTTIQMIAIGAMILGPIADQYIPGATYFAYAALWVAAALTVYTGVAYFNEGSKHIRPQHAPGDA